MSTDDVAGTGVEQVGEHTYLVSGRQDGEPVEVRVVVDPATAEQLGVGGLDDGDVVRATLSYLLEHQQLDELPAQLDLVDVDAAYEGFAESLRTRLGRSDGGD